MKYLIYDNKQDALDRSEAEGLRYGLTYHLDGIGTRYVTSPVETTDGQFALLVDDFLLSDEEQAATVDTFSPVIIENPLPTLTT